MSESTEPRVIKRYANRKLYDMSESRYITHEEIAHLLRGGEEVRIIDNRTQEDLTSTTLTQILLEEERRIKRPLPIDTLRNFFQTGGDFIQRHIKQPVASLKEEAEKNVRRVFGKRDSPPEPAPREPPATSRTKPTDAIRDALEERWLEIQHAFAQLDYPKRINDLERRVEHLEAALAKAGFESAPAEPREPGID
jgi:polyhydroxyalkanoate synthesis repressor PhaR